MNKTFLLKLYDAFSSMKLMGILIVLFAISIAIGTFIESSYGTTAAKSVIYQAFWFEVILFFLSVNLVLSLVKYKTYQRSKIIIFIFHIAFIFIAIGAWTTRYIGFEGTMHIRENSSSNHILSEYSYLTFTLQDGNKSVLFNEKTLFSPIGFNRFNKKYTFEDNTIDFHLVNYYNEIPQSLSNIEQEVLIFNVSSNNTTKKLMVRGSSKNIGRPYLLDMNGIQCSISYGAKEILLPFSLQLIDFELNKYPASNSPSSYASYVKLIDTGRNVTQPHKIFMNHTLNYRGFKFFQSSYDQDEKGTVLSVNSDYWGTLITYFGYFLMTLGMILVVFIRNGKIKELSRKIREIQLQRGKMTTIALLLGLLTPMTNFASSNDLTLLSETQYETFNKLLVQGIDGRIKPMSSLSYDILMKIRKSHKFQGIDASRVIPSMFVYTEQWRDIPFVKIKDDKIKKQLNIKGDYASFKDFISDKGVYKIMILVRDVYRKDPKERNKEEQEIMKIDEAFNICYMIFSGGLFKIFPDSKDIDLPWYAPTDNFKNNNEQDSLQLFMTNSLAYYAAAIKENDDKLAQIIIQGITNYQNKFAKKIIPSSNKQKMEVLYSKIHLFFNLIPIYGIVGFVLLVLQFINILRPNFKIKTMAKVACIILFVAFGFHTLGLALRWYVSNHAPWSNGYESMVYIAWTIMLSGLVFYKKSSKTVSITACLTALSLGVAHLSDMNPQITNLVPVLKSYWLTIHVSVIIMSYGFLALGALLGLINLILLCFNNTTNRLRIELTSNELGHINEMTLMIGLFLLSIGTFLGGVWANESWGRYWGWDPKETWALVSILVYTFILHLRLIPKLDNLFLFNVLSLFGFYSILMTYFGVNYYLSGLHSYAAGDSASTPLSVYISVVLFLGITIVAYYRNKIANSK